MMDRKEEKNKWSKPLIKWILIVIGVFLISNIISVVVLGQTLVRNPIFNAYSTYPEKFGGCIDMCEGTERLHGCSGEDLGTKCRYTCVGSVRNSCD